METLPVIAARQLAIGYSHGKEIFFRDDKIVRNQQGSLFFGSAGQVVEADIGLIPYIILMNLWTAAVISLQNTMSAPGNSAGTA